MSLKLSLHTQPDVPLEADVIAPDKISGMDNVAIAKLAIFHGSDKAVLGDFFKVEGKNDGTVEVRGKLDKVKMLGAAMNSGRLKISGNAGMHLGAAMSGGEIIVSGNAGDWVGAEMAGGRITVKGNIGHMAGAAYRGGTAGMSGGEILVHGNAGNEAGNTMLNGLIAIGGDCADFAGVNMKAGTLVVFGDLGPRAGASMRRGTLVGMGEAEMLPTFTFDCVYHPLFLRPYLHYLRQEGFEVAESQIKGRYERWSGDSIEMNRGEALLLVG